MKLANMPTTKSVGNGGPVFHVLDTGDIFKITWKDKHVNLLRGNPLDGSLLNVYLRVKTPTGPRFARLVRTGEGMRVSSTSSTITYTGTFMDLTHRVTVMTGPDGYDIRVGITGGDEYPVDLFFGHDVALMHPGTVLNSEAYTVQYIDFKALGTDAARMIRVRQNQGNGDRLLIASDRSTKGFSTDGFQFFKTTFKETGVPGALFDDVLESVVRQYEFAYPVLQTETFRPSADVMETTFSVRMVQNHVLDDEAIERPRPYGPEPSGEPYVHPVRPLPLDVSNVLSGYEPGQDTVDALYPVIRHPETIDGRLASFFTDNHAHVVTRFKERLVERPHGHMLLQGGILGARTDVLSSTHVMYGVFSVHNVLGNTSFNALSQDLRNPLNLHRIAGFRLWIRKDGVYRLLAVPSLFEVGLNHVAWRYLTDDDTLLVRVYGDMDKTVQRMTFESVSSKDYDILLTYQMSMGPSEYLHDIELDHDGDAITVRPSHNSMTDHAHPDLRYRLSFDRSFTDLTGSDAFQALDGFGVLVLSFDGISSFVMDLSATETGDFPVMEKTSEESVTSANTWFDSLLGGFRPEGDDPLMERLDDMMRWYVHNALIHYSAPHGLEQYNGAAWGTRDVTQGPFELMLALGRMDLARHILLTVFSRQFLETGDFPQWFMYNDYRNIQGKHSHADIIIWPLKALSAYVNATGDDAILDEPVPFMSFENDRFTESHPIKEHVRLAIEGIRKTLIKGTSLPKYGGGDWNDTLQPANHALTERMVSGWTVALLYETLDGLEKTLGHGLAGSMGIRDFKVALRKDYESVIVKDGIPAGFYVFGDENPYLLHPSDRTTGLSYRLLPLIRPIIAGLADKDSAKRYMTTIDGNLKFPDGVRLTNDAITYHGGKNTYFVRAETAANFGREIGLQYVHAHIRYIEASAAMNDGKRAFEALGMILPINLEARVNNALPRQSNLYFSSSDADFRDRYQAKEEFNRIKEGTIGVKGGWRIYSSGPGILIHQIMKGLFGLSHSKDGLVLSPTLDAVHDGLVLNLTIRGRDLRITYRMNGDGVKVNGVPLTLKTGTNAYGKPYVVLPYDVFDNHEGALELDVPYVFGQS
jgi:1,2-beta-oligoglucan phosphorylase